MRTELDNKDEDKNHFNSILLISFLFALVSIILFAVTRKNIFIYLTLVFWIISIIFSIINNHKEAAIKKMNDATENNRNTPKELSEESKEKIDRLLEIIKNKTEMDSYEMELEEAETDIFESKVGGFPYWDRAKEYPTDSDGNKLVLLAQINFEKEQFNNNLLPTDGILQFFIGYNDVYGMNFNKQDEQKDWRVIYHKQVNKNVNKDEIAKLNIPTTITLDEKKEEYFPFYKEYKIKFNKKKSYIGMNDYKFDNLLTDILEKEFNAQVGNNPYSFFSKNEEDYFIEHFNAFGHKLLGYPDFTQSDPRDIDSNYDTLLLQIDTDGDIIWGDSGICNFFINKKDLENGDFSRIIYNWDCY